MLAKIYLLIILIFTTLIFPTHAKEVCSRTATINFQEILIDTSSSLKGEGLRYYLEKDKKALHYLNKYQKLGQRKWQNAIVGTAGSALLLAGLMTKNDKQSRSALLISGVSTLLVNFFLAKTLEMSNEIYLIKAINEYNKRNLPRIDFYPDKNVDHQTNNKIGFSLSLSKTWTF